MPGSIRKFDFYAGKKVSGLYEIQTKLGSGYEGEVYLIEEVDTGIDRAAKFFYPEMNRGGKTSNLYASKLHRLRHCEMVIQYHHKEKIRHQGHEIHCLISDFVEGELLGDLIQRNIGKRLPIYEAFQLFYELVCGVERIHSLGEYHGDLHTDNIFVKKYGIGFDIKLFDLYHHGDSKSENMQFDVVSLIRIFHEMLGGQKHYKRLPNCIKRIICGLKTGLIRKRFRNISKLRQELENLEWDA